MIMHFDEFDNMLKNIPKAINNIIYDYAQYDFDIELSNTKVIMEIYKNDENYKNNKEIILYLKKMNYKFIIEKINTHISKCFVFTEQKICKIQIYDKFIKYDCYVMDYIKLIEN